MSARQILLFRDPSPLVERLGLDFFRQLPERPGVYLMRGESDALLYVGKARNLRKRLGSYRVANPDRMPRRHLRLVRAVKRIEIEECPDERSALEREAQLLRAWKPRFNRAGTWPAAPKFLAWKITDKALQLTVTQAPESGWQFYGPLGSKAWPVRAALLRLLWVALWPNRGICRMPVGWFHGIRDDTVALDFPNHAGLWSLEISRHLDRLVSGEPEAFGHWALTYSDPALPFFEKAILQTDIEFLIESFV